MSCLLTKLEFASWLGVSDPYSFFGISEEYDGTNAPSNWAIPQQFPCECNLYGDEFEQALEQATSYFLEIANWIPIPTYFEDDFAFPYAFRGFLNTYGKGKKIELLRCPIIRYGKRELNIEFQNAPLTKTSAGSMLEYFTIPSFQVPNTIRKEEIKVFFTPTDGGYYELEDCCEYEIKPLRIDLTLNGDFWDVEIEGHAVLFKKPSLFPIQGECLPNISSTYVDEVDVYLEEFDACDAGYIAFDNLPCSTVPCEDETLPVCFKTYDKRYAEIIFAQCNEDDPPIYVRYTGCEIVGDIRAVHVNWQAGLPFENCNLFGYQHPSLINNYDRDILSLLTVHFLGACIVDWCNCQVCVERNLKALKRVQYILQPDAEAGRSGDTLDWISANPHMLNEIPSQALLRAMTKIDLKNKSHLVC